MKIEITYKNGCLTAGNLFWVGKNPQGKLSFGFFLFKRWYAIRSVWAAHPMNVCNGLYRQFGCFQMWDVRPDKINAVSKSLPVS